MKWERKRYEWRKEDRIEGKVMLYVVLVEMP